jgi:hypothetical protein
VWKPHFLISDFSFFFCCFQSFQLPLCPSFHFTCFLLYFTFNKRFVGRSRKNFRLLRFTLVLYVPDRSFWQWVYCFHATASSTFWQ